MSAKALSPGAILDAYCTKCRATMNHTLIALVNGKPVKVKCNTCGGEHNYRLQPGTAASSTRKSTARTQSAAKPAAAASRSANDWRRECDDRAGTEPLPYSMDAVYKQGALVGHPKFGIGVVQEASGERKMTVLFETGIKILRCG